MNDFVLSDGGRKAAGYQGVAGDCAVRALCHMTGQPYGEIYQRCCWVNWCAVGQWTARKGIPIRTREFELLASELGLEYTRFPKPVQFATLVAKSRYSWPLEPRMIHMYNHATVLLGEIVVDRFDPRQVWTKGDYRLWCYGMWEKLGSHPSDYDL